MIDRLLRIVIWVVLAATLLSGCAAPDYPARLDLSFAFDQDAEGWVVGFADLPAERDPSLYELGSGHRPLPSDLPGSGIYVQGHNRSDDLFMYLKRPVRGLRPNATYRLEFAIELATNVPENMMGIGGSPGTSVYVKVGASTIEPTAAPDASDWLRMNIDKGNQAQQGQDMINVGHVAHPEVPGEDEFRIKSLSSEGMAFEATADAEGSLWLIVGTDSGFEGLTTLYYAEIEVTLEEST